MRFASFASIAASVLLSQSNAFAPIASLNRQTTVVRSAISSQWTMMPEEPVPEVRFNFHVSPILSLIGTFLQYLQYYTRELL
jgi:hypothetical protein